MQFKSAVYIALHYLSTLYTRDQALVYKSVNMYIVSKSFSSKIRQSFRANISSVPSETGT